MGLNRNQIEAGKFFMEAFDALSSTLRAVWEAEYGARLTSGARSNLSADDVYTILELKAGEATRLRHHGHAMAVDKFERLLTRIQYLLKLNAPPATVPSADSDLWRIVWASDPVSSRARMLDSAIELALGNLYSDARTQTQLDIDTDKDADAGMDLVVNEAPQEKVSIFASLLNKLRRPMVSLLVVWAVPLTLAALIADWLGSIPANPSIACLKLERTSMSALAEHRAVNPGTPVPLPAPDAARPDPIVLTIEDSTDGTPVRSVFTTSEFSHAEGVRAPRRPGGGKVDDRLRVGGHGDTYLSLLMIPVPNNRPARRAVLRLTVLGDEPTGRPTTMTLRVISDPWNVMPGPQQRLWWRDCPRSDAVRRNLPAPGPPESSYEIDITNIYNQWARGLRSKYGIMLEPEQIGHYGRSPVHYSNFSTFYSTRAPERANRPKLILTY